MELDQLMTGLAAFIRKEFDLDDSDPEFDDDVHLFDYGYVDSFGAVKLGTFIQDTWDVEITDKDLVLHPLNTVREISTLVQQKLQAKVAE